MLTLFAVIHIFIGFGLIMFVLLQDPKGGAMGVFSGGSSSNSFFGSSGATNFLTKTTKWLAILFAASCLGLTYLTAKRGSSVLDNYTPPAAAPVEGAAPAEGAAPNTATPPAQQATPPADAPKQ